MYKPEDGEGLERGGARLLADLPFSDERGGDICGGVSAAVCTSAPVHQLLPGLLERVRVRVHVHVDIRN